MSVHRFTVYDAFKRNAKPYRDKIAIVSEDQEMNFGERFNEISRVAGGLTARGIEKGDFRDEGVSSAENITGTWFNHKIC
jgi:non-ribosomal peptide synthetase component E (peptide arylation enzyme)